MALKQTVKGVFPMTVKKLIEIEIDFCKDTSWSDRRFGRLHCALSEIASEISKAQSEGYEIAEDWRPPVKFTIPMVEDPKKVESFQLRARARNLQKQIRDKEKSEEKAL